MVPVDKGKIKFIGYLQDGYQESGKYNYPQHPLNLAFSFDGIN
jgi:hypothetical protein